MRMDGEGVNHSADGKNNWPRQWGEDVWQFTQKIGIEKFHYVGKCHGTNPGWYITRNHPEALLSFSSFFLSPHIMLGFTQPTTRLLFHLYLVTFSIESQSFFKPIANLFTLL